MKKIFMLALLAGGLFFTANVQAQEATLKKSDVSASASVSAIGVSNKDYVQKIDNELQDLQRQKEELKNKGIQGDALEARLNIINEKEKELMKKKEALQD